MALAATAAEKIEILRDQFSVPSVFARTAAGTAFGSGYAQAEDRTEALLRNLLSAKPGEVSAQLRPLIDAYCAGINRYLQERSNAAQVTGEMVAGFSRTAFSTIHGSNDV